MILFPAVDIKNGQCVRLKQGRKDDVSVFSVDPVAQALQWQKAGATFLHLVDLDGAFEGEPTNFSLIRKICSALDIPVQLGGGIRDVQTAEAYIRAGVRRVIIGTMALSDPDTFELLCKELPGRIGVSLDALDGQLKTRGWVDDAGLTVDDVLPRLENLDVRFIIYTDIGRDGMHAGVNTKALAELCSKSRIPVIAAGGVSTMADIKALAPLVNEGLEGVITGRAIYEGTLDLAEALQWIKDQGGRV
ncbi:MAG: 1-(5-phosphoribosyl)-5-[(5-phosphoribosylamino)methylideneamino]imidazole-4-carboxamide isomerase [Desulfovibrio sp.]|uniref:1-(5-phosphoribosyl)-5-[(5- phosphoribosylamino)methylideneamino]imidazole-4- carboxamide isomerase n=1 Tax=Desulfovibrio sp. 7SRBS1 TaxID=3378064 RepID=UPI003B3D4E3F